MVRLLHAQIYDALLNTYYIASAQDVGKNRYKWLPKKDDNLKEEKGKLMKKKIDTTSLV